MQKQLQFRSTIINLFNHFELSHFRNNMLKTHLINSSSISANRIHSNLPPYFSNTNSLADRYQSPGISIIITLRPPGQKSTLLKLDNQNKH